MRHERLQTATSFEKIFVSVVGDQFQHEQTHFRLLGVETNLHIPPNMNFQCLASTPQHQHLLNKPRFCCKKSNARWWNLVLRLFSWRSYWENTISTTTFNLWILLPGDGVSGVGNCWCPENDGTK